MLSLREKSHIFDLNFLFLNILHICSTYMGPVWTGLNSFKNFFRLRDVIRLQSSKFKIHLRIEMLWNYRWKLFILKGSHQRRTFENMICKGTVHRNKWIISEQRGRARGRCGGSFGDVVDHSLQLPHLWPCFICKKPISSHPLVYV